MKTLCQDFFSVFFKAWEHGKSGLRAGCTHDEATEEALPHTSFNNSMQPYESDFISRLIREVFFLRIGGMWGARAGGDGNGLGGNPPNDTGKLLKFVQAVACFGHRAQRVAPQRRFQENCRVPKRPKGWWRGVCPPTASAFAIRRCFAASRMPPTASAFACGSASATPPQGGSDAGVYIGKGGVAGWLKWGRQALVRAGRPRSRVVVIS